MKLVRLTLKNIKSYLEEEIEFYDGVNFISGINGAGKTTIIEAVGYALFDSNPFSAQRQFIRKGAKKGIINIVIEAADERLYCIIRSLHTNGSGSWAVFDQETGTELHELHGNQDVKLWLTDNLGIGRGLDPTRLFEDVIGISQGKFITPFLERPRERKKIFNTILQLESYREAFDKSSSLVSAMKERIAEKEGERKVLLVKVEDLEEVRARLKINQNRADVLSNELQAINKELSGLQKGIAVQEEYRTLLEKGERDMHSLGLNLAALLSRKENLQIQLKEAELNRDKAAQAKTGYCEYQRLKEVEKELEVKRKKRDELNNKLQELRNKVVSLQVEITGEKDNRKKQIQLQEAEKNEIVKEGEELSVKRKEAANQLTEIEKRQGILAEQKAPWQYLNRVLSLGEQGKAALAARFENYRQMLTEKEILDEALKNWTEKERLAISVPVIEQELEGIRKQLNENKARLATLEENREASSSGMCPFLEMPCLNVQGDLKEYFSGEISKIIPLLSELVTKEETAAVRLTSAKKGLEEFCGLQHHKKRLEQIKDRETEMLEAINREKEILVRELDPERIRPLHKIIVTAERALMQAGAGKDEDPLIRSEKVKKFLQDYTGLRAGDFTGQDWDANSTALDSLLLELRQLKEQGDVFWERAEAMLGRLMQEKSGSLAALDTRLATLRERYQKVNGILSELRDDGVVRSKEKELQGKEREMEALTEKLKDYLNLEEEWKNTQEDITRLEPAFIQYMQNIEGASKLENLSIQMQSVTEDVEKGRLAEKSLQDRLRQMQEQYTPDLLAEMRGRRDELVEQKGGKEKEFSHATQEVERDTGLIREKEKICHIILSLEKEISRERKAQELLRLTRLTLNQSGERIAEVYRQHLGRAADSIYQQISKENVNLSWGEDYEVKIIDSQDEEGGGRTFGQLSGGEKMTAALAVRLALLKQLSGLGIGFFDEPTANLDERRRSNLARIIPDITQDFRQLFVISHDDTFDAITENVILLSKESGVTQVVNT